MEASEIVEKTSQFLSRREDLLKLQKELDEEVDDFIDYLDYPIDQLVMMALK